MLVLKKIHTSNIESIAINRKGNLIFDPSSFDLATYLADPDTTDTVSVYIESKKKGLLKKLKKSTFRLHGHFGEDGYIKAQDILDLSDIDSDGISERGFTVNAYELAVLVNDSITSGDDSIEMYGTAESTGKLVITADGSLGLE